MWAALRPKPYTDFGYAADEVVLVTTPDNVSVMDCYATMKTALGSGAAPEAVRLIVNKAASQSEARDVFQRIEQSTQRFLQRQITWLGQLPDDLQAIADMPSTLRQPRLVRPLHRRPRPCRPWLACSLPATLDTNKAAA